MCFSAKEFAARPVTHAMPVLRPCTWAKCSICADSLMVNTYDVYVRFWFSLPVGVEFLPSQAESTTEISFHV